MLAVEIRETRRRRRRRRLGLLLNNRKWWQTMTGRAINQQTENRARTGVACALITLYFETNSDRYYVVRTSLLKQKIFNIIGLSISVCTRIVPTNGRWTLQKLFRGSDNQQRSPLVKSLFGNDPKNTTNVWYKFLPDVIQTMWTEEDVLGTERTTTNCIDDEENTFKLNFVCNDEIICVCQL